MGSSQKLPGQNAGRNVNLGSRENLDKWKYQQSKQPQGYQGSDRYQRFFSEDKKEAKFEKVKSQHQRKKIPPSGALLIISRRKEKRIRLALYCFQQRAGFRLQAFMLAKIFSLFLFVCIQGFPFQFLKNILINQNIK